MKMNMATLYYDNCCMCHSSLEIKCLMRGTKMLIALENNIPPTLNLTDNVNKNEHKIKMHSLKQPCQ